MKKLLLGLIIFVSGCDSWGSSVPDTRATVIIVSDNKEDTVTLEYYKYLRLDMGAIVDGNGNYQVQKASQFSIIKSERIK
jgi:hypothetical protein